MQLIDRKDAVLVVIDVQGKLAESMSRREDLFRNLELLIGGMALLQIPVLWTEQVPEKLGPTSARLQPLMHGATPIRKASFSCVGEPAFLARLREQERMTVLLCGIEAHVCVYQTALELLTRGFRVELVADAIDSRRDSDRECALGRMRAAGAGTLSTEMVLFELQRAAEGDGFRQLIELVKSR